MPDHENDLVHAPQGRIVPACAVVIIAAMLAGCVRAGPVRDPRVQSLAPVRLCPNGQVVYRMDGHLVTLWYANGKPLSVDQTFAPEATPESVC